VLRGAGGKIEVEGSKRPPTAFISYTWAFEEHQNWVLKFAEELIRNGIDVIIDRYDLQVGEEITQFMERGIRRSDFLILVCSRAYTEKANGRVGGVGFETVITSAKFLYAKKRNFIVPVVRDNDLPPAEKLPAYLGSTKYIELSAENWAAEPIQEIVQRVFSPLGRSE